VLASAINRWGHLYAPFFVLLFPLWASAAPFTPQDDDVILATLPKTQLFQNSEVDNLRQQLKNTPDNIDVATQLATLYIQTGRSESDPRYFGYAQSVLSPWWQQQTPPAKILFLRANLHQGLHHFDKAETDLKQLIQLNRRDQQAWWLLATIYMAQGKHKATEASCTILNKISHQAITTLCYAMLWSRTGNAEKAYKILRLQIPQLIANPTLQTWAITLQAEISTQLGQAKQAEKDFQRALSQTASDPYLLKLYVDHLLLQEEYAQIMTLTKDWKHDLALAIRATIAADKMGDKKTFNQLKTQLRSTFELERLRGSKLHQREAALYQLEIERDASTALALAFDNWRVQKEPEDATILLKAATLTNDTDSIMLIRDWLQETQLQDTRIDAILNNKKFT